MPQMPKRRFHFILPFCSALFFTLSFPSANWWPFAFVCLIPLFVFLEEEERWYACGFLV